MGKIVAQRATEEVPPDLALHGAIAHDALPLISLF